MRRNELCINVDPEAFKATLAACNLEDKAEFSEPECAQFNQARLLIEQGQTYEQVTAFFQAAAGENGNGKGKSAKGKKAKPSGAVAQTAFPELMKLAAEQINQRLSWSDGAQLLKVCELSDDPDHLYSDAEVEQFLDACDALKSTLALQQTDIAELVGDSVYTLVGEADQRLANLKIRFMRQRAEEQVIADQQQYLRFYTEAAQQSQKVQQFWADVEVRAQEYLQGKSHRSIPAQTLNRASLPPSSND